MSVRAAILKRLTDSRNLAVERAVELALANSASDEQRELADVLLERNRRGGWIALIRSYHTLDESIRDKMMTRPRDLFGPLAETMQEIEGPARENVIAIIQRCSDVHLVYLLAEALMDSRAEVRTIAGNSLLEAVRRHSHSTRSAATECAMNPDDSEQLRRAVEVGLRNFKSHRQTAALQAAMIFERQQDAGLWTLFQDPYDDRTRAATILLRAPSEPALASALLLALGSSLKPAASAGIAAIETLPMAAALAAESYRLVDPIIHDAAQGITHLRLLTALRKDPPWNADNWAAWLRLIESVGMQPAERLNWLTRMLESATGERAVAWKMGLARAIADTGTAEAAVPLAHLVADADERVARHSARLMLMRRQSEWREGASRVIAGSAHASVRRLALFTRYSRDLEKVSTQRAPSAQRGFDKAWNEYTRMPPAVQHTTARTVASDPALAEQLHVKFTGGATDVAQALRMIAAMPSLLPYRSQIIALCGHSDPRIAAMAVRLIGRLEDPRLRELLEAAARHTDARVRANAIESMEELHIADKSQQVMEMLNSRHNRERANAIKALGQFNFGTARECLTRMLTDPNPLHRMSALWVVGQLNLLDVMRQVSSIARRDPNLRVRRRAAEMLQTLSGSMAGHT